MIFVVIYSNLSDIFPTKTSRKANTNETTTIHIFVHIIVN